jgi:hypothetical protein
MVLLIITWIKITFFTFSVDLKETNNVYPRAQLHKYFN